MSGLVSSSVSTSHYRENKALTLDSRVWWQGGGSWTLKHLRCSVARAAVQRQHVLTRLWQCDHGPVCQVTLDSCQFSESDSPASYNSDRLSLNLFSLKIIRVSFYCLQARILADPFENNKPGSAW